MGDEDENDIEDMNGYEPSGVWLTWFSLEDLIFVFLPTRLGVLPAVSEMINWLAHEVLLSPSFSKWFHSSPFISLFLYHHLCTQSWDIPIYLFMQWSWVNTKSSIHWVLHYPKMDSLPHPASLSSRISHLLMSHVVLNSLHSHDCELTNAYSLLPWHLCPNLLSPDQPRASTTPISISLGLGVHLPTRPIMALIYISKFLQFRSTNASPNSFDHWLQVHLQVAWFGLQMHLQTGSNISSKCISEFNLISAC